MKLFCYDLTMRIVCLIGILHLSLATFVDKQRASSFLRRLPRSNYGNIFEELLPGNMERECVEERCSREEAHEIYNDLSTAEAMWRKYKGCKRGRFTGGRMLLTTANADELRRCVRDRDHCYPNPCREGNTLRCIDQLDDFKCVCASGFSGARCEQVSNHCLSNPCSAASTVRCISSALSYQCVCKPGFSGTDCDVDLNECLSAPCGEHGSCLNKRGKFECLCDDLFYGKQCQNKIYDCRSHGCQGYSICNETDGSYVCECLSGYAGENCTTDVDECLTSQCDQWCNNTFGSFACSCRVGFEIEGRTSCRDVDECAMASHACSHKCENKIGSFQCSCRPGYILDDISRRYCKDVDECANDNGGCPMKCLNQEGTFSCACNFGYLFTNNGCQDEDECAGSHGCDFECFNTQGSFYCTCPVGYVLNNDQKGCIDVDECAGSNPVCHQVCYNTDGSYSCSCNPGFHLQQNQCVDDDECDVNNGSCEEICVNTIGSFVCECPDGFELIGRKCFDYLECASNPCINGRCLEGFLQFTCSCFYGFSGAFCQHEGDPCRSNPCLHGSCIPQSSGFSCLCEDGYSGTTCNDDVNECLIENGGCAGVCNNVVGSFSCQCQTGFHQYEGECRDVDECEDSDTCGPSFKCLNIYGSFKCECPDGFHFNQKKKICQSSDCHGSLALSLKNHLQIGSRSNDFVSKKTSNKLKLKFSVSFDFRTFQRWSTILDVISPEGKNLIQISINNGTVQCKLHNVEKRFELSVTSSPYVADGRWHKILLQRRRRSAKLLIDGTTVARASTRRSFSSSKKRTMFYFGGLTLSDESINPFRGCMRNIRIQGTKTRWDRARNETFESHHQCFENVENTGSYFNGRGFVRMRYKSYVILEIAFAEDSFTFSADIQTGYQNGRIVTFENNSFALVLEQGSMVGKVLDLEVVRVDGEGYCDATWKRLELIIQESKIKLIFDGEEDEFLGRELSNLSRNVFIGGVRSQTVETKMNGFHGNMKNILINKKRIDIANSPEYLGVNPLSIPV